MTLNQKGVIAPETILIFVVLAIIGAVGWFVYDTKQISTSVTYNPSIKTEPSESQMTDSLSAANLSGSNTSGWLTFEKVDRYYSYSYPAEWKMKDVGTYKSTFPGSKSISSKQLITSSAGDVNIDSSFVTTGHGAQLAIVESYDPDKPLNIISDCKKDIKDDRLLKQIKAGDTIQCFYKYSETHYVYRFNAGAQRFNISLLLGDKTSDLEKITAIKVLISVADSFKDANTLL